MFTRDYKSVQLDVKGKLAPKADCLVHFTDGFYHPSSYYGNTQSSGTIENHSHIATFIILFHPRVERPQLGVILGIGG